MMDKSSTPVDVKQELPETARSRDVFDLLRSEIDRLFDDFSWPDLAGRGRRFQTLLPGLSEKASGWLPSFANMPAMDLVERNGEYFLSVDLPGLAADEIELRVSDGTLSVKAEKAEETAQEEGDFHLRERCAGAFERTLALPSGIDLDKIQADYANGVLKITLPKTPEALAKERRIEVKAA